MTDSHATHLNPEPGKPTPLGARALGPDLSRGLLLLFIALANSHTFLYGRPGLTIRGMPVADTAIDRIVAGLFTTLVDGRSYTMFAALFGYGLVQIARRQEGAGLSWESTKRLLRRRGRWMFLIGFLHAMLLFAGDIVAAYGLLAIVLAPALRSSSRRLAVYAAIWMILGSAFYGFLSLPDESGVARRFPFLTDDPSLHTAVIRAGGSFAFTMTGAVTAAGCFLLGVWAARQRLLEEPSRHRTVLRRVVAIGLGCSVLGGLPLALLVAGVIDSTGSQLAFLLGGLHAFTGYAGGPAYAAAIALWASRIRDSVAQRPVVRALQATGQRSMTCYLAQSVVWHVAFAPYLLDLGRQLRVWQAALLGAATWALTVLLAEWMRSANHRGPFEVFLRRRTYQR